MKVNIAHGDLLPLIKKELFSFISNVASASKMSELDVYRFNRIFPIMLYKMVFKIMSILDPFHMNNHSLFQNQPSDSDAGFAHGYSFAD